MQLCRSHNRNHNNSSNTGKHKNITSTNHYITRNVRRNRNKRERKEEEKNKREEQKKKQRERQKKKQRERQKKKQREEEKKKQREEEERKQREEEERKQRKEEEKNKRVEEEKYEPTDGERDEMMKTLHVLCSKSADPCTIPDCVKAVAASKISDHYKFELIKFMIKVVFDLTKRGKLPPKPATTPTETDTNNEPYQSILHVPLMALGTPAWPYDSLPNSDTTQRKNSLAQHHPALLE